MITEKFINEFLNGSSKDAYNYLGAHLIRNDQGEIFKTVFNVYAPHAKEVRLIFEDNHFDGSNHIMDKVSHHGFFSIEIPYNTEWKIYKYEINTHDGKVLRKADPFGFFHELRPQTGSKVYDRLGYQWNDSKWFETKKKTYEEPLLIYELHLGSWRRNFDNKLIPYSLLVKDLISYLKDQGFTHVEFMPIYEYPFDGSWGYQGTGYYAPTSRYGSPKDLMYLIDQLHQNNIGVIIDWVLGHICRDEHGLSFFDGTPLFEFEDKKRRENVVWGTDNIDFSKGISRSFMLSALFYWVKHLHVDGFRIDAVSNLIYYLGDSKMGVNKDAINFLRTCSTELFKYDDRIIWSAEDSTDYPLVTHPVSNNGLGFNYKWNMGFMNDTLKYFKLDPLFRKDNHSLITFGMMYQYNEQFILPFSHDEVVHMKGSLINKMPGDYFSKFAQWRLLLTYQMTYPGKKLLFMGQEFASFSEWAYYKELDWHLFDYESHKKANDYFKALAKLYNNNDALYKYDFKPKGFKWLVVDDNNQSFFSYARFSDDKLLIVVLNMTANVHHGYKIGVPFKGVYKEVLNSDKDEYYGSNIYNGLPLETKNEKHLGFDQYIKVEVGPFSGIILEFKGDIYNNEDKGSRNITTNSLVARK